MKEKWAVMVRFGYGAEILVSKEDLPRIEEVSNRMICIAKQPDSGVTKEEAERLFGFEILEEE